MATNLNARIDQLDDLDDAWDLLDELKIDTSGVADLDEAKKRLRVHANSNKESRLALPNRTAVTKVLERDQKHRDTLVPMLSKVEKFITRMPGENATELQKAFPHLDQELTAAKHNLRHEKCAILIAGETSAGKSTLLNLLLGQALLPVAHLSVTSVICELKYGPNPFAVAHPWPSDSHMSSGSIDLSQGNAEKVLAEYLYQQGDRSRRFPYQRVEIFWPSEWLRAGVTIVDSPGIGESEEITNLVMEYMPKAFGFIYVINSTNAGGVQADRLQDLLLSFTSSQEQKGKEERWQLDPRCAIFVANKWEQVPRDEREEVKNEIYSKLTDIWTGLDESQVFFLSAKEAMESMKENVVNEDYGRLLDGIEKLLPIGLNQRISKHFRLIDMVLHTSTRIVKTYVAQLEVGDIQREANCEKALRRLQRIEESPKKIMAELEMSMKAKIKEGVADVKKHLSQEEVIRNICHWEMYQCPDSKDLEVLSELMYAYAIKRIRSKINQWDKENQIFQNIQTFLIMKLRDMFVSLASELANIENMMAAGVPEETSVVTGGESLAEMVPAPEEVELTTSDKILLGVTAPIWVPLGLVVGMFALPVYGIKKAFKKGIRKRKLSEYRTNKANEMEKVTKMMLDRLTDEDQLEVMLQDKIRSTCSPFKQMIHRIPHLIKADKEIIQNLKKRRADDADKLQLLYPLQGEAIDLLGELDLMYMLDIRSYDIKVDDIVGWKETDVPVAEGTFAKVFKASLRRPSEARLTPCAIKVLKDEHSNEIGALSERNASDAWLEESNLRKLQNDHVVQYLGTALKSTGPNHYHLMVMEFCDTNLEKYILDRDSYTPPTDCQEDPKWMFQAAHLAWQLADGLQGIHSKGFVHRDLKPANILMTKSRTIRLADLGVSKAEMDMSGTLVGTPLYMAPEVSSAKYNHSADMFSYGLILWELWYGRNVFDVYKISNLRQLPALAFTRQQRPEESSPWCKTMLACWSESPEKRPSAAICRKRFADNKDKWTPKKPPKGKINCESRC